MLSDAAAIVDSIVAEDIGKRPDATIADALQRISGVQIERTAGEGAKVNIGGMPQVLTTLNGEQLLSPWSITDVQADYSDIPASMISGVNVYNSQFARMPAGGISGITDLKTFAPRDLPAGWTGTGSVEASERPDSIVDHKRAHLEIRNLSQDLRHPQLCLNQTKPDAAVNEVLVERRSRALRSSWVERLLACG